MAIYRGSGGAGDATGDATNASVLAVAAAAEAQASAASAASSATNAASSASAASTSETDAGNSATAAATSATDAAASASTASTQATNASNSATAAASSASAASSSASSASSSASAASTSATNAASSASSASTSATNASNSASAAATSATNAANSASDAADSAALAATFDPALYLTKANPSFTGTLTGTGDIRLNNGTADGAQLQLASSGYSDWNLDNYSGRLRAYYGSTEYFSLSNTGTLTVPTLAVTNTVTTANNLGLNPYGNGFKNRIINGAMMIDQRNAGASVTIGTGAAAYTLDRWATYASQASKFSVQQNAGSVTPPSGYSNYLGVTSLSSYSVTASDEFEVYQQIEGFNTADLGWGAAGASTVTLSFWVRSSLTGTFGGSLQSAGAARSYPFSYTINSANTWEQKTITITGDTTGTWNKTNGAGIAVFFGLGQGSSRSSTAGSWQAGNYNNATGATSVVGTNGATFYITGVQLEKGSTATAYDYRPYGTELALCQRYYSRITGSNVAFASGSAGSTTNTQFYVVYPQSMRSAPTILLNATQVTDFQVATTATTINNTFAGLNSAQINITSSGLTQYRPYLLTGSSSSAYIEYSSEL